MTATRADHAEVNSPATNGASEAQPSNPETPDPIPPSQENQSNG